MSYLSQVAVMSPTVSPDGIDPLTVQWFDLIVPEWEKKKKKKLFFSEFSS